jgi:hypothetical protein
MSLASVLLPLFVLVALTFGLIMWQAVAARRELASGRVRLPDMALGQKAWTPRTQQIANCFNNQFQLPILFYVLVIFALMFRKADIAFVVMEWLFVISRFGHAYVHTGSNHVPTRGLAYAAGLTVLIIMWIIFAVRILAGPLPL